MRERNQGGFHKDQPLPDKIAVASLLAAYIAELLLIPLDRFHFHLLPRPGMLVSSAGMLLFLAGWTVISLTLRQNSFAIPIVRPQEERHQVVVDGGLYAFVRHPLYAGILLMLVGVPLWLESYAAALSALASLAVLAVRIHFEEDFLVQNLPGYGEYRRRVHYRLVPLIW
jgi:protein-S-isoprenylcysteine O-methyltransferase Ste14